MNEHHVFDHAGLASRIAGTPPVLKVTVRQGVVTDASSADAAHGSKDAVVSVSLGGASDSIDGLRFLGPAPDVDDVVFVLDMGADKIVLGTLNAFIPVGMILYGSSSHTWPGFVVVNGQATTPWPRLAAIYGSNLPTIVSPAPGVVAWVKYG